MLSLETLSRLYEKYSTAARAPVRNFDIRGKSFRFDERPAVMGVVNLSSDSWYRESVCLSAEAAIRRGRVLAAQGADLVDLGAESTLAHAARVDGATQSGKLKPVVQALSGDKILVSVETYSFEVAREAVDAGAAVLNLTGSGHDAEIFRLAASSDAAVILCYVQGVHAREVGTFDFGHDPIGAMIEHFRPRLDAAIKAGLERIFIDPGLGFYYRNLQDSSVRVRHQLNVFLETFRLRELGFPIGHALPHAFEYFGEEVRSAEPFFAVLAALGKTNLFRTHEVPRTKAVLDTLGLLA